jgi:hypothetical protein
LTVLLGLAMAAKVIRRPALRRGVARLHEHLALVSLAAIAVHGFALLGDHWLKPGWGGITVPFLLHYRPGFTGLGIIAGYLALLLGPSFYLHRRIGARRWRRLHRATMLVGTVGRPHAWRRVGRVEAVAAGGRARPACAGRLSAGDARAWHEGERHLARADDEGAEPPGRGTRPGMA